MLVPRKCRSATEQPPQGTRDFKGGARCVPNMIHISNLELEVLNDAHPAYSNRTTHGSNVYVSIMSGSSHHRWDWGRGQGRPHVPAAKVRVVLLLLMLCTWLDAVLDLVAIASQFSQAKNCLPFIQVKPRGGQSYDHYLSMLQERNRLDQFSAHHSQCSSYATPPSLTADSCSV